MGIAELGVSHQHQGTLALLARAGAQTLAQPMKRRRYYQRPIKRHYGGELRGLATLNG